MKDPIKLRKKIIDSLEQCSVEELEYVLAKKKAPLAPKAMTADEKWMEYCEKRIDKILPLNNHADE